MSCESLLWMAYLTFQAVLFNKHTREENTVRERIAGQTCWVASTVDWKA